MFNKKSNSGGGGGVYQETSIPCSVCKHLLLLKDLQKVLLYNNHISASNEEHVYFCPEHKVNYDIKLTQYLYISCKEAGHTADNPIYYASGNVGGCCHSKLQVNYYKKVDKIEVNEDGTIKTYKTFSTKNRKSIR